MAAIALPQERVLPIELGFPAAEGSAGHELRDNIAAVLRHWQRGIREILHETTDDDDLTYESIPLKPAFTIRVKYHFVGEMKPMPYPLDE